jgi:hypothetical protein
MSNDAFTVKRVLDLQRAVGLLHSRDMMTRMLEMNLSPEVRELVDLGLKRCDADEALTALINKHQAAYDATLPVQPFQAYESVYSGDGDPEPDVKYGIFDARTEKEAVKLAHEAGATQVTNARPLTQSELVLHVAKQQGMTVVDVPLVKMENADMLGLPTAEK